MASLGKLSNSIVSAINENNLSLANLNFDFSLVTVQAPPEYHGLGNALTLQRRENAEQGTAHRTARKLGALFESVAPHTPLLLSAYGQRVSHIIASPGVSPSGNAARHGPFVDFVGADATSIWAAATSGSSSIAVHLLACILARAFEDSAAATSVWAELVLERQREVERLISSEFSTAHFAAVNAASQQFPREELRQWDASARAWLLSADTAMIKEHTQLQLLVKNITLPVLSGGHSLYANVTSVWRHAMAGLERLLAGEPQSVTNGDILLAISSWHLYPNLVVLGSQVKTVDMRDLLLKDAGVITIGMTMNEANSRGSAAEEDRLGIYWSLSLSHYRYYGRPVQVIGRASERLIIEELHLIALGSLFGAWSVPRVDLFPAARWLASLWACVDRAKQMLQRPLWLRILAEDANHLLAPASDSDKQKYLALVYFGHRRFRTMLGMKGQGKTRKPNCHLPWFGLRSAHILGALSREKPSEGAIQYLREIATHGGLHRNDALITWVAPPTSSGWHNKGHDMVVMNHVYASAVSYRKDEMKPRPSQPISAVPDLEENEDPYPGIGSKRKGAGFPDSQPVPKHRRWVARFGEGGKRIDKALVMMDSDEDLGYTQSYTSAAEDFYVDSSDDSMSGVYWQMNHQQSSPDRGESSLPQHRLHPDADGAQVEGDYQPKSGLREELYGELRTPLEHGNIVQAKNTDSLLVLSPAVIQGGLEGISTKPLHFHGLLNSSQDLFQLWFRDLSPGVKRDEFEKRVRQLRSGAAEMLVPLDVAVEQLEQTVEPLLLWQYFEGGDIYEPDVFIKPFLELMSPERKACAETLRPFRNLALATTIYEKLEGATISSRIVDTGLADINWGLEDLSLAPTRKHTFCCIAMLETGVLNLKPKDMENVVGLSSGNSLFVLSHFLADPSAQVNPSTVTRLVGNVGRAGVSLLVPPSARPLVRPLSTSYRAVNYAPFDSKWEDSFTGTSLHLSFTKHEFPVDYGVSGIMDHQVFLVESVFSVHDRGEWVADLDLLGAFSHNAFPLLLVPRARNGKICTHPDALVTEAMQNATSIDTWEEVLDSVSGINIVRAYKNWAARLAVATVLWQTRKDRGEITTDAEMDKSPSTPNHSTQGKPTDFAVLGGNQNACYLCVYRKMKRMSKDSLSTGTCFYLIA